MYEDLIDFALKSSIICHLKCSYILAELSRARGAHSGALWVRKFSFLPIRENLVMTSAYSVRSSVHALGVGEGNQILHY